MTQSTMAQKLKKEAREEVDQELVEMLKIGYKDKLRQLKNAEVIVKNLEREIEELELKMEHKLGN